MLGTNSKKPIKILQIPKDSLLQNVYNNHSKRDISCGLALLRAPKNCFDYILRISDGNITVKLFTHRCVLLSHGYKFNELINDENYFDMSIMVKKGFIGPCIELIQYMYLKDPRLITDKEKMLELCTLFEMPTVYSQIRNNDCPENPDKFDLIHLDIDDKTNENCLMEKNYFINMFNQSTINGREENNSSNSSTNNETEIETQSDKKKKSKEKSKERNKKRRRNIWIDTSIIHLSRRSRRRK
jgi:hypothetical protein